MTETLPEPTEINQLQRCLPNKIVEQRNICTIDKENKDRQNQTGSKRNQQLNPNKRKGASYENQSKTKKNKKAFWHRRSWII